MDERTTEGIRLRILIGESDHYGHHALWEEILTRARDSGLSGATVLRGIAVFGASIRLHTAKILRPSHDLPIVI